MAAAPLTADLPPRVQRSMRLSIHEGVLYAVMVGFGDTYFLADAVRLGASALEQGLVITLPLFGGALGSVLAVRWLMARPRRKHVVVAGALAQAGVLGVLALLHHLQAMTPALLIGLVVVHQAGGQCAGTGWSSWYGDLIPSAVRGRYFGVRSRFVYLATCLSLVASGVLLHWLEPGRAGAVPAGTGGGGFVAAFSVAALARLASALLLATSHEPAFRGLPDAAWTRRFLRTSRGRAAWRLVLVGGLMQLCVYVGSPYFGPYMLKELEFSYLQYMAATVCVVLLKVATLPMWGRSIDAYGGRSIYGLAALLVGLVPIPWLWADGLVWVLIAQGLSGLSWAAYEVSFFSLALEATYKSTRPYLFAAQNVIQGSAQLLGGLLGALLLGAVGQAWLLVFAVSAAARTLVALAVPYVVPRLKARPDVRKRELLLRVVGIRPHSGVMHRPLESVPSRTRR